MENFLVMFSGVKTYSEQKKIYGSGLSKTNLTRVLNPVVSITSRVGLDPGHILREVNGVAIFILKDKCDH